MSCLSFTLSAHQTSTLHRFFSVEENNQVTVAETHPSLPLPFVGIDVLGLLTDNVKIVKVYLKNVFIMFLRSPSLENY